MKVISVMIVITMCLFAETKYQSPPNRPPQIKIHNINQVEMCISNFGKFGQTEAQNPGMWWPRGSGQNYIFGAGFWFATVDSMTGDTLVSISYCCHGAVTEYGCGLSGMPASDTNAIIYMYPDTWPPPASIFPMAPQDPRSHQDSWCCLNDSNPANHVPGDTRPIGLEFYQTVYVWDLGPIDDIIFMMYEIKNISHRNLYDCYFGIITDNDIGNESGTAANDRICAILNRPYYIDGKWYIADNIGYQWQEDMEPGTPPWWPGTIGYDLLQTPFDLEPGMDKDNDGILDQYERDSAYYWQNVPISQWDVDHDNIPDWRDASENPQHGLTAFKRFTLSLEPNSDNERYLSLAGYNFETGQYEPFDTIIPDPDDQRFLMASGPFDLTADSEFTMVFAIVLANWHDIYLSPDTALVQADYWAQHVYNMGWQMFGIEEHDSNANKSIPFTIKPSPSSSKSIAAFTLSKPSMVSIKIYNSAGQLINTAYHGQKPIGQHTISLNFQDIAAGTYFVTLKTNDARTTRSIVIMK